MIQTKRSSSFTLLASGLILSACATQVRQEHDASAVTAKSSTPAALHNHAAAVPVPAAADHAKHATAPGIAPAKALGWLKNGNLRFTKRNLRKDGMASKDVIRLSKGQQPHTIVLSCSDSRVAPELVFDQKLGEIFVIRTAGEALDYSAIASIEYALAHLGTKLIVVMGHESCGAVKAALETPAGKSAGSPDLDKLVADIRPRFDVLHRTPASVTSKNVAVESFANATGVASDLVKRSAIIRDLTAKGEVVIKSAIYRMESGEVTFN